jgi:hypothetical protein
MTHTGFELPQPDELVRLREIVQSAHPALAGVPQGEFDRAFWVAGSFYRRPKPDSRHYFSFWTDVANERLRQRDGRSISGDALLAAIIGHNDVPWHRQDPDIGQVLEVGIDPYSGSPCTNAWRGLLRGEPLRPPLPSPSLIPRGPIKVVHAGER